MKPSKRGKGRGHNNVMKVAMYYSNKDVRLEEMPVPEIGPGSY